MLHYSLQTVLGSKCSMISENLFHSNPTKIRFLPLSKETISTTKPNNQVLLRGMIADYFDKYPLYEKCKVSVCQIK
jgi:hypothetical protein